MKMVLSEELKKSGSRLLRSHYGLIGVRYNSIWVRKRATELKLMAVSRSISVGFR